MRRHDLAAAPFLGLLLSATLSAGLAGQGTAVDPGRTYRGGAAIVSPLTGVSFRLPSGIQAEWEPNLQSLVMAAPDRWPAEEAGEGFLIDGYRYVLAAGGC